MGVSVNALRVLKDLGSRFPDGNSLTIAIEQTLSLYYDIRRKRVRRLSAAGEAFDKSMLKTRPLAECMRYALFWTVNSFPNITRKLLDSLNETLDFAMKQGSKTLKLPTNPWLLSMVNSNA